VTTRRIRVLLADDQEMVRAGLKLILSAEVDIDVVAEVSDGAAAVAVARRLRPDVALMDVRMPKLDGIRATRQILAMRSEEGDSSCTLPTRVIVLTTFNVDAYVYDSLRAGASGFLLKDSPAEQLVAAIRTVADGNALIDPAVTRRVIEEFARTTRAAPQAAADLQRLSTRERQILALVAAGLSNSEIASRLYVAETTVKTHIARTLGKRGLRDRIHAVIYAYENGVTSAAPPETSGR
jgi:DNA-binding NarL/FixJ family response regulator